MEQSITSKRNLPKKIDTSSLNQEKKSFHSENEVLHVYSLINQGKVPRYVDFSPAFLDVFPKNTFKTSIHPGLVPPHGEVCAATFSPSYVHPSKSEKETFTTSLQHPTTTNTTDFGGHPALFPSSSSSTDTWSSWNTRSFQEPRTPHSSLADLISLQDQEELMRTNHLGSLYFCHSKFVPTSFFHEFLHTQQTHRVGHMITWIQFLERECSKYEIDLLILSASNFELLCASYIAQPLVGFPTLLDHHPHVVVNRNHLSRLLHQPGRRYRGIDGHWAAIVKLQAVWRRWQQRRRFIQLREEARASARIPKILAKHAAKAQLLKKFKDALPRHEAYVEHLQLKWKSQAPTEFLYIHVPSCSLLKRVRHSMKTSMEPFEWNHVGRLSDVLHSNCLVMLVTHPTDPLLPLALHYLERSSRSPTALNHVRIVHPECRSPPLPSHSPLAFAFQMSLASLHACQAWVLQHPHSTPIYVPWVPSHFDTRNASQCHAAMSPVWTRETLATVCFSHLPSVHCSASPLTPTSSIFHDFATLLLTHPHQTHWQWTLAHELPPRSTLQVSVAQLKSKKKKWPTDVHALLSFLESIQHDRQAFPVPLANYFQLFTRFGGRIEAVFKGIKVLAHLQMSVVGVVQLLSTWEVHPFDNIEDAFTLAPVYCVSIFTLIEAMVPYLKQMLALGYWDSMCFEFLYDQKKQSLICLDILPNWSLSASMQGLVRIITDTRCDVHTFHVDDPCTPVLTVSTPYFQAGQGLMITDMSHWKPSRLKMAGAAKWLDYEKLRVTEHQLLESSKIHTGEEPRCWILVHGLDHFCFTSSISTLNMSLGEELFIDRDRRGSMFLNTQTPKKLLLSVDDSVTQAIQRVYNVMHTFSIIAAGTDPNNSNFELWSGALFELQTRYLHRDQAYGLLPTDPDYVYQCPTFRSPTCPTEQPSVPETPENPSVVDRYQQALLDRELYGYQLKIQSYKQLSETIQIEIKDVKKDAEQVHQLNQDFQVQYLPFEEEQQQHQQHHHHQHHHQHHHHLHPHPTQPQPLPPQHFHQEVSSEVFDPSMNITKLQAQKAKQNSSLKIIKNVFHAVRRKH